MSVSPNDTAAASGPELEPPICEYCGMPIDEDDQRCAALHDGRCRP